MSGMALAPSAAAALLVHPFLVMFKPAVAMSARWDCLVVLFALAEMLLFLGLGLWMAKNRPYE